MDKVKLSARPPPPPRPSASLASLASSSTHDDLRSSDSDSRSHSTHSTDLPLYLMIDMPKARAVIIGGGFAGASLAISLSKLSRLSVTLIDTKENFLYTPSLIHLVSQPTRINSIVVPYKNVMKRGTFVKGAVTELTRQVVKYDDEELPFDYCFICTGMFYMVSGNSKRSKPSESGEKGHSPVDKRKSPRRHRSAVTTSAKTLATLSPVQKLTSLLRDTVYGPIFHAFVASKQEFVSQHRALLFMAEVDVYRSLFSDKEKEKDKDKEKEREGPSRSARKQFTAILQQFVQAGAPYELRFTSSTNPSKDSIKEQLLAQDPKTADESVFKPAFVWASVTVAEVALDTFIASISTMPRSRSNSASSAPGTSPNAVSAISSQTANSRDNQPGSPPPNSTLQHAKGSESGVTELKGKRSTSGGLSSAVNSSSKNPDSPRTSNAMTGSGSTSSPISSRTSMTGTTVKSGTGRLVMEIHETQFSDHASSPPGADPLAVSSSSSNSTVVPALKSDMGVISPTVSSPRTLSANSTSSSTTTSNLTTSTSGGLTHKFQALVTNIRRPETLNYMASPKQLAEEFGASVELAHRIAIVGGDLVAIELAAEIHTKYPNKILTIIHSHRQLLMNMSEQVRVIVDNFFKNRAIVVRRKTQVVAIQPFKLGSAPEYYLLLLDDGSTLEVDKVFCCNVDFQHGNTSFLEAHFSEHLDGRGFAKVDKHLRFAGTENIFAFGDVAALNEYKIAERARAHSSLISVNMQRLLHGMELETYRERALPKTYDLVLGPEAGVQIENGRFVRFGPGPVERRAFTERRVLHRFGALSHGLEVEWSQLTGHKASKSTKEPKKEAAEEETAGSHGETSSDAPSKKASRKRPMRRFSEHTAEEDSEDSKANRQKKLANISKEIQ